MTGKVKINKASNKYDYNYISKLLNFRKEEANYVKKFDDFCKDNGLTFVKGIKFLILRELYENNLLDKKEEEMLSKYLLTFKKGEGSRKGGGTNYILKKTINKIDNVDNELSDFLVDIKSYNSPSIKKKIKWLKLSLSNLKNNISKYLVNKQK